MLIREFFELASFIVTTVTFPLAVAGLLAVRKQMRRDALTKLFAEFDTREARAARKFVYNAEASSLRLKALELKPDELADVEDTLAMLERAVYPIVRGYLPEEDAYNLYGGVLLAMSKRLWPFIEDHRQTRTENRASHRLVYRRYLEEAVLMWVGRYAAQVGVALPAGASTSVLLNAAFPTSDA